MALRLVDLLKISFLTLLVGQLGRIPLVAAGSKEAPLLLNDLVLVAALVVGGVLALQWRRFLVDWTSGLALAFVFVGGASALLAIPRFGLSPFELAFSLAYLARWAAYFGFYLLVLNFVRREDIEPIWRVMEGAVIAFALFGIFQSAFLPGFAQLVYPDAGVFTQWDPQGRRLVSTFLDPNLAGGLILVVLLIQGGRMAFGTAVARWKPLILLAALALTLSRSSALAFLVGVGVLMAIRGPSKRVLTAGAWMALVGLLLSPILLNLAIAYNKLDLADPSLLLRFVAWGQALTVLIDHPFLGVGFNTYGFVQLNYGFGDLVQSSFGLDGGLLFIAVMTGGLGVIFFGGMVLRFGWEASRVWRETEREGVDRGMALGTLAATVALLVHSLFLNSLLYPFLMQILWVLWGMVAVIYRSTGPSPAAVTVAGKEEACSPAT